MIDIKGTRDYIRFIMEDGTCIKGSGEMVVNGFCVYNGTLLKITGANPIPLVADEIAKLKEEITRITDNTNFRVSFNH